MQKTVATTVLWLLLAGFVSLTGAQNPSGGLLIDPIVGYNLVVDSNIETPAARSPTAAYLGVKFCNANDYAISSVVSFQRRIGAGDVEIRMQSSPDVKGGWAVADQYIKSTMVTDDGDGLTESVRVTLSVPLDDEVRHGFVRLLVRQH